MALQVPTSRVQSGMVHRYTNSLTPPFCPYESTPNLIGKRVDTQVEHVIRDPRLLLTSTQARRRRQEAADGGRDKHDALISAAASTMGAGAEGPQADVVEEAVCPNGCKFVSIPKVSIARFLARRLLQSLSTATRTQNGARRMTFRADTPRDAVRGGGTVV